MNCVGCQCEVNLSTSFHQCHFAITGFMIDHRFFPPCQVRYHMGCIRAGVPFVSRHLGDFGLSFPRWKYLPIFVCELCTVRAHTFRRSNTPAQLTSVMMLERMRIIDTVHSWTESTLQVYTSKIERVVQFQKLFNLPILCTATLVHPPVTVGIPLMWSQLQYSIQPGVHKGSLKYSTVRGLRSAVSAIQAWELVVTSPDTVLLDTQKTPWANASGRATDTLAYYSFAKGMSRRIGTDALSSTALLAVHVNFIDSSLRAQVRSAKTIQRQHQLYLAGLANAWAWTTWCRASELFNIRFGDVTFIHPRDSVAHSLPLLTGAFVIKLKTHTKSSPTEQADVVVASTTASGLSPQFWWEQVLRTATDTSVDTYIFTTMNGIKFDSRHFRNTYLYPLLGLQRFHGEPTLQMYSDEDPSTSLSTAFFSMHSYRRGGRTHVAKRRDRSVRAASKDEIAEHGRWQVAKSRLDMPTYYLEFSLSDRVALTRYCM
jgi:hypothetical protein